MTSVEHKEYIQTLPYKMILILQGYRRIAGLTGGDFAERVHQSRVKNGEELEYRYDSNFLIFVETGFVQLSLSEVQIYAEKMANAYDYDVKEFTKAVEFEANNIVVQHKYNFDNISVVNAISAITCHMRNYQKQLVE